MSLVGRLQRYFVLEARGHGSSGKLDGSLPFPVFLVPDLRQSSRTRASLTIVETRVDTMVSMVQAHASYRGRCCRRLARERTHRLANRKFAFNRIFGEGKENLNVLRKETAHCTCTCTVGAFCMMTVVIRMYGGPLPYAPYAHIRSSTSYIRSSCRRGLNPGNGLGERVL